MQAKVTLADSARLATNRVSLPLSVEIWSLRPGAVERGAGQFCGLVGCRRGIRKGPAVKLCR